MLPPSDDDDDDENDSEGLTDSFSDLGGYV